MSNRNNLEGKERVKGTRRLVREKAMQILAAMHVSGVDWLENFDRIFPFEFRDEEIEQSSERLLTRDEIALLEADCNIDWDNELVQFGHELIRATLLHKDFSEEMIRRFSQNWELDRIAHIDRIVMQIAIAEMLSFQDIPPKVTINEAIEIVKRYSTDKSGVFVNGILDSILDSLKSEGRLKKSGRGLLDESLNTRRVDADGSSAFAAPD